MTSASAIGQKLWNYCNVLRDAGLSYGDYLEQLTHLIFLEELARQPGTLGVIFRKSQNKVQDPAMLRRLIADLIDREDWSAMDIDVKGAAYEELLKRNAEDAKTGAGQYFTPRPLIQPPGLKLDEIRSGPKGIAKLDGRLLVHRDS